jgi:phosphatidylserine synthase
VGSYLLVSELKLPALKFKKGQSYLWLLIIFVVSVISFFFVNWLSIPIAFMLYLISPIMEPLIDRKRG